MTLSTINLAWFARWQEKTGLMKRTFILHHINRTKLTGSNFSAIRTTKYLPLLYLDEMGLPFPNFVRFALTGLPTYKRSSHIPDLTLEQQDALDSIEFFASKNAVDISYQKGDMVFLNNWNFLHARAQIHESQGYSRPRKHLLRLTLSDSEYRRNIPASLKSRWGGNIRVTRRWQRQIDAFENTRLIIRLE